MVLVSHSCGTNSIRSSVQPGAEWDNSSFISEGGQWLTNLVPIYYHKHAELDFPSVALWSGCPSAFWQDPAAVSRRGRHANGQEHHQGVKEQLTSFSWMTTMDWFHRNSRQSRKVAGGWMCTALSTGSSVKPVYTTTHMFGSPEVVFQIILTPYL